MHGEAEVEYRHPKMEPIFRDTYGIPVYQEQLMRAAVELAGYTPSESDELRKAISKKIKKDIDKHRDKFVNGAINQGMEKQIAEAIYSDWEEFARYGFNKSHAADYGVIAVETAFLKAHYPAEYMAATLTASAGATEKVALYVADARSMGVPVLPPDINVSGWDFEIEDIDGKPNIRFGFGAVKNVGKGAVELIITERNANGKFNDLNNFARRVDLRTVGKRALECIIKVGAMDVFGNRVALLASLDRIVSISNNHFRAVEAGQMSLFGEATGVVEQVTLPDVNNVDKREMLSWERELIGLYISDHPLTPYQQTFAQIVSYFSGQLGEAQHEEKVRVAGLVTHVRPYMTKTNKPMGFVTLEDIQGNIDLVLFPRTWEKMRELMTVGQIVIVEGKVDTNSTPPKILVDTVRTEIKILEPLSSTASPQSKPMPDSELEVLSQPKLDSHVKDIKIQSTQPKPVSTQPKSDPVTSSPQEKLVIQKSKSTVSQPVRQVADKPVESYAVESGMDDMPPPPDNFPDGWESQWQPSFEEAAMASQPEPKFKKTGDVTPPRVQLEPVPVETHDIKAEQVEVTREAVISSIYIPLAREADKDHPPKQITVNLRSTGNKEEDRRRIKTIFGTLISFHGRDRFSFQIFENGGRHLIDFPNDTTRIGPDLLQRLLKLMGEESWHVEEITFQ
jgi:DNA polymerase-3 subunit alpha